MVKKLGMNSSLDKLIRILRYQLVEMSNKTKAAHLASALSCVNIIATLYIKVLRVFPKNPNKLNYVYSLTPKGIALRTNLTISFMKKKMKEYDELKDELKKEL